MSPASTSAQALFWRLALRFFAVDTLVGGSLVMVWILIYGVRDLAGMFVISTALFGLRSGLWLGALWRGTRPMVAWYDRRGDLDDAALRAAAEAFDRLSSRTDRAYAAGLLLYIGGMATLAWTVYPQILTIGRGDLPALGLQMISAVFATPIAVRAMTLTILDQGRGELAAELAARGLSSSVHAGTLAARFNLAAALLVAMPLTWMASLLWLTEVRSDRAAAEAELRRVAELAASELEFEPEPESDRALSDGLVRVETPPVSFADGRKLGSSLAYLDLRSEVVQVAAPIGGGGGGWVVASQSVNLDPGSFALTAIVNLIALVCWGLVSITSLTHTFLAAVQRLSAATRRVVEVGDLVAMGPVPILSDDEVGVLTRDFNRLLADLVTLAAATQAVARGDLSVNMDGRGDLAEAFRRMLEQLHEVVAQIRETSVGLATAASEIHAATQEQESASEQLATGMRDVSRTMDSLAASATQIDGATKGVLENAEGTLATTDEMARKIGELSEHTKGIAELLEVIRDVADRSDLLALNGSLEATRAGEAGRGFALVAAEMRRLAERVTGTVADVRELVADIKSSTATTVMATEQSRRLAEGTAAAARRITDETQRQSAETEQASLNVREVAHIIAQTSVATTQTRAAAEGLMVQAEQLEQLIQNFELRSEDVPPAVQQRVVERSTAVAAAKGRSS